MTIYIVRRFFQSLLFILLAALLVYTGVILYMPTGPKWRYDRLIEQYKQLIINQGQDPNVAITSPDLDRIEKMWKVDKPWPLNFFTWLFDPDDTIEQDENFQQVQKGINVDIFGWHLQGSGILTGDLGTSTSASRGAPVSELIADKAGNTLLLVSVSLALSFLIGIPIGVLGAVRKNSLLSHVLTFFSFAGRSIPPFALGLVLVLVLAVVPYQLNKTAGWTWMPYLPASEPYDDGQEGNFLNRIYHLILPAITLAVIQIVWIARYVRSTLLDVLSQDYIRTARAKGLAPRRVIYKHALRNALIPLITIIGLLLPGLISGATIVEQVFSYEGLGMLYYRSLGGSFTTSGLNPDTMPAPIGFPIDFSLAMVMTIMLIAVVAFSNMLADILYAVADPRVSYS
ncbi:MAG: ABC transporter permease [Chloroflexota bacterium]